MFNKIKTWWNKPWTNGTYCKCCFGGMLMSALMWLVLWVWTKIDI